MPDNPFTRRLLTIPALIGLFLAVSFFSPILAIAAAIVDAVRLVSRRSGVTLRALAFLWIYLVGEIWAVLALGITALLPGRLRVAATYRLQGAWASWNLAALQALFSLELHIEGSEFVAPGPIVLLSRHASIVDTLLPARLVSRDEGIRLRYVLKRELLVDPALDMAGNRLPNAFIDRRSRDTAERNVLTELATGLGDDEGILIYPEGTRFSEEKLRRLRRRAGGDGDSVRTVGLSKVLPPRPGGTLALLDATTADVVLLGHRGLEGLATVREIWAGDLVGTRVEVRFWRIPREQIPEDRSSRVQWLNQVWADLDDWVTGAKPDDGIPA